MTCSGSFGGTSPHLPMHARPGSILPEPRDDQDTHPQVQPTKIRFVYKLYFLFALLRTLRNSAEMESAAKTDVNNWELS